MPRSDAIARRRLLAATGAVLLLALLVPAPGRAQPANDACANAQSIGAGEYTGSTRGGSRDGSASCATDVDSPDVWFRYTAGASGKHGFSGANSNFQAAVSIHDAAIDGCPGGLEDQLACARDYCFNGSCGGFNAVAGHEYLVRVGGYSDYYGAGEYTLDIGPVPANDDCAQATVVGEGVYGGDTRMATTDGGVGESPDIWFRYVATVAGRVSIDTLGSPIDARLSVHNPAINGCPGEASDQIVASQGCGGAERGGCVSIDASPGTPYLVRIWGSGNEIGAVQLTIQRAGAMSGSVVDAATGLPPPGATQVYVYNEFDSRYANPGPVATVYTSSGNWTVDGLRPGIHRALAEATGYVIEVYDELSGGASDVTYGTPIMVSAGAVTAGIDFTLDTGGRVSGRLTDAITGAGIVGLVKVFNADYTVGAYGTSDPDGQYTTTIGQLPTGRYFARAEANGHVTELHFDVPCQVDQCDLADGTPIDVTAGATTPAIDFALARANGSILGKLTVEGAFNDRLTTGRRVLVYDASGNIVAASTPALCAEPPLSACYYAAGLAPGTYFARTDLGLIGLDIVDELYRDIPCPGGACNVVAGTPIDVRPNVQSHADIDLGRGGRISGTLLADTSGLPIEAGPQLPWVEAYSAAGELVSIATPVDNGYWEMQSLGSGTYYLRTVAHGNFLDEVYNDLPCPPGHCDPLAGTPIAVTAGATVQGIAIRLAAGNFGGLSGRLTRSNDGAALPYATVTVHDASGQALLDLISYANGQFQSPVNTLLPGNYFLRSRAVNLYAGLADELYDDLPCIGGNCNVLAGTPITVTPNAYTTGIAMSLSPQCTGPLVIAPGTLPDAVASTPYQATFSVPSATLVPVFALGTGVLPPGLSLQGDGTLSGILAAAGTFNFTIGATDAAGCFGSAAYAVTVACGIAVGPASLPDAIGGVAYEYPLQAQGGAAPYTYTATGTPPPNGLGIDANGWLRGIAPVVATTTVYGFGVGASDGTGCAGSDKVALRVLADALFTNGFE